MRAAALPQLRRPEVVVVAEIDSPHARPRAGPSPRARAASVNFPDVLLVANEYQL